MLWNALTAACNAIMILTRVKGWKCKPVLVLTFDDIGEYARAEADIALAFSEQALNPHRSTMEHSDTYEIMGIKVRLDCRQRYKLPSGEIIAGADALRHGKIQTGPFTPGPKRG